MKKLFFIVMFLAAFSMANAQDIIIIRANSYTYRTGTPEKWNPWTDWDDCDIIISINIKESTMRINNGFYDEFNIVSTKYTNIKGKDPVDGDPYERWSFNAVDRKGRMCLILLTSYESQTQHVSIVYPGFEYVYEGKITNNQ